MISGILLSILIFAPASSITALIVISLFYLFVLLGNTNHAPLKNENNYRNDTYRGLIAIVYIRRRPRRPKCLVLKFHRHVRCNNGKCLIFIIYVTYVILDNVDGKWFSKEYKIVDSIVFVIFDPSLSEEVLCNHPCPLVRVLLVRL